MGHVVTLIGGLFMSTSTMHLVLAFLLGAALIVFVPTIGTTIKGYF